MIKALNKRRNVASKLSAKKSGVTPALVSVLGVILLAPSAFPQEESALVKSVNSLPRERIASEEDASIRPFRIAVPEASLIDLRQRIVSARWPDRETVANASQGVQLAKLQELVRYWATDYDWRKLEARVNALPQFVTEIDGLDIHFIHVRSRHPNALH